MPKIQFKFRIFGEPGTLTDLADAMDVTKGAASGTLHRAERRIIKTFLGEPAV